MTTSEGPFPFYLAVPAIPLARGLDMAFLVASGVRAKGASHPGVPPVGWHGKYGSPRGDPRANRSEDREHVKHRSTTHRGHAGLIQERSSR